MNNKYKKQNKNKKNNSNQQKFVSPEDQQELKLQALEADSLISLIDLNLDNPNENYCYVIEWNWYKSWKDYVGYDEVIYASEAKKNFGQIHPGPINTKLLDENCYQIDVPSTLQEYNYLRQIIRSSILENKDYFIVDWQTWNYFESLYGGICVKRPNIVYKGQGFQDIELLVIKVTYLISNNENTWRTPQQLKLQVHCDWRMSDLDRFLNQIAQEKYNLSQISDNKIWLINPNLGFQDFKQIIQQRVDNNDVIQYDIKQQDLDCQQSLENVFKNYSSIVYEINNNQQWILNEKLNPNKLNQIYFCAYNNCQNDKTIMLYSCSCQEVQQIMQFLNRYFIAQITVDLKTRVFIIMFVIRYMIPMMMIIHLNSEKVKSLTNFSILKILQKNHKTILQDLQTQEILAI